MSPKPKAARWLTEAFRDGVDDQEEVLQRAGMFSHKIPYDGAWPLCWLAQFDPARHPCAGIPTTGGPYERIHLISRQRVENAMWDALPPNGAAFPVEWETLEWQPGAVEEVAKQVEYWHFDGREDLILLAAWDPRNGALACEHHHRRFDGHACSPMAPQIQIPRLALPTRFFDFVADHGLESEAERRFPIP